MVTSSVLISVKYTEPRNSNTDPTKNSGYI